MGLKRSNKHNSTAAVYAHWHGVQMQLNEEPGFITVHLASDGWFWMIPLPDDVMSVGFVGNADVFKNRRGNAQELYLDRISRSPTVAARMVGAERVSDITATGNYSYRATSGHGEGWMAIGDAFAFLDPVFSSGVLLAMTAAELGVDVAQTALRDPAAGQARAARAERQICRAMDSLGWLVYRINTPVLRSMFMSPSNKFGMRDGLVAMLAGNLRINWRNARAGPGLQIGLLPALRAAAGRLAPGGGAGIGADGSRRVAGATRRGQAPRTGQGETVTPFQKATRPLISFAASFGSG